MSELPLLVKECLADGERAIGELFTFATFCEASIALSPFTARAPDLARDMTLRSGVQWGDGGLKRMEKNAEALKRGLQDEAGLGNYLHGLAYVRLCTALETTVDGLLLAMLSDKEAWLRYPGVASIKALRVDVVRLLNFSRHEQVEYLAREIRQGVAASIKEGVGRYESVLEAVGLSGPVPESVRSAMFELTEVRNVIVHRNAIADRRLKERCPTLKCEIGRAISIPKIDFAVVSSAAIAYLLEIWRRVMVLFPGIEFPHETDFREKVLRDLDEYAEMRRTVPDDIPSDNSLPSAFSEA